MHQHRYRFPVDLRATTLMPLTFTIPEGDVSRSLLFVITPGTGPRDRAFKRFSNLSRVDNLFLDGRRSDTKVIQMTRDS